MSVEMGLNRESCLSKGLAQKIGLTRKGTLNRAFTIFFPSRLKMARSETRAARATRANIFIAKTMSDSIISTFLGHRRHKNPLLFKIGHLLKFTRVTRVFVLGL